MKLRWSWGPLYWNAGQGRDESEPPKCECGSGAACALAGWTLPRTPVGSSTLLGILPGLTLLVGTWTCVRSVVVSLPNCFFSSFLCARHITLTGPRYVWIRVRWHSCTDVSIKHIVNDKGNYYKSLNGHMNLREVTFWSICPLMARCIWISKAIVHKSFHGHIAILESKSSWTYIWIRVCWWLDFMNAKGNYA